MKIRDALIDELLAGQGPSTVLNQDGLLGALKKALLNRMMAAEFDHHLAQECAGTADGASQNHRNGSTRKRVLTGETKVEVTVARDSMPRRRGWRGGKSARNLPVSERCSCRRQKTLPAVSTRCV
jgi:putative transposase